MVKKRILHHYKSANAILQTVVYSDLFGFPLKKSELWYFLKNNQKISRSEFLRSLERLSSEIMKVDNYYCLSHRKNLIPQRQIREKISHRKYHFAHRAVSWLRIIPTIYLIGISGSVAYHNADEKDDIDFFIITKKNTVWLTRLACLLLLQILGIRRKKDSYSVKNKICLNMLIDERQLCLPEKRQDVYTAHEIAQLIPLFEMWNMHNRFLDANSWITEYMPNVLNYTHLRKFLLKAENSKSQYILHVITSLSFAVFTNVLFEAISRKIQQWKMKRFLTNETITDTLLAFHPYDYRFYVLSGFKQTLIKLGLEYKTDGYDASKIKIIDYRISARSKYSFQINKTPVHSTLTA